LAVPRTRDIGGKEGRDSYTGGPPILDSERPDTRLLERAGCRSRKYGGKVLQAGEGLASGLERYSGQAFAVQKFCRSYPLPRDEAWGRIKRVGGLGLIAISPRSKGDRYRLERAPASYWVEGEV